MDSSVRRFSFRQLLQPVAKVAFKSCLFVLQCWINCNKANDGERRYNLIIVVHFKVAKDSLASDGSVTRVSGGGNSFANVFGKIKGKRNGLLVDYTIAIRVNQRKRTKGNARITLKPLLLSNSMGANGWRNNVKVRFDPERSSRKRRDWKDETGENDGDNVAIGTIGNVEKERDEELLLHLRLEAQEEGPVSLDGFLPPFTKG